MNPCHQGADLLSREHLRSEAWARGSWCNAAVLHENQVHAQLLLRKGWQDSHPPEGRANVPGSTARPLGLGEEGDGICHTGILSPMPV